MRNGNIWYGSVKWCCVVVVVVREPVAATKEEVIFCRIGVCGRRRLVVEFLLCLSTAVLG